eukprot:GHVQ01025147.1.p1 GENE.GHVQ01025147.1~~GHVQ01025147.1.p1  ORF type:complete len:159 (-),score=36.07 GHVQ01025147.1:627-1103(-)
MAPPSSGPNTRAVEAKARKKAAMNEALKQREDEREDAYWRDDHKVNAAKICRKNENQHKAEEQRNRKAEIRRLAEEEFSEISKNSSSSSKVSNNVTKVNRAEIAARAAAAAAISQKRDLESSKTVDMEPLTENPNKLLRDQIMEAKMKGEDLVDGESL